MKIDAVITWVDGNDPIWQEKINTYTLNKIDFSNKNEMIRFNSIDEIEIAIESIIKNAPFVQRIYLVTDDQKPTNFKSLQDLAKMHNKELNLVDHKVIFRGFEECIPTFNSISISTMLYRIPDLAEHFILFNDDTFLMREAKVSDFFIAGKPVIRGQWDRFYEDKKMRTLYYKIRDHLGKKKDVSFPGYKKAQQKSAKLLGLKKYIKRGHTPVSLRKSTIAEFYEKDSELLRNNVKHRFRHESQFIISALANHLEVLKGDFILTKDLKLTYFQSYKSLSVVKTKLKNFVVNKSKIFMCFQNLEVAEGEILDYILLNVKKQLDK